MRLFLQPSAQSYLMANTFVSKLGRKYLKLFDNFRYAPPTKLRVHIANQSAHHVARRSHRRKTVSICIATRANHAIIPGTVPPRTATVIAIRAVLLPPKDTARGLAIAPITIATAEIIGGSPRGIIIRSITTAIGRKRCAPRYRAISVSKIICSKRHQIVA